MLNPTPSSPRYRYCDALFDQIQFYADARSHQKTLHVMPCAATWQVPGCGKVQGPCSIVIFAHNTGSIAYEVPAKEAETGELVWRNTTLEVPIKLESGAMVSAELL